MSYCLFIFFIPQHVQHMTSQILLISIEFWPLFYLKLLFFKLLQLWNNGDLPDFCCFFKFRNKKKTISLCISQFQAWPSPWATPRDSHILVAPGLGFHSFVLPGGLPRGFVRRVFNQSKKFDNFEKSAIFALSLKQMSSSLFYMFIYARSAQCNSGPIYTLTNTQHIRIYPGKLKSILVKI